MTTNKPRVSIGLPVFNGQNFLEDALNSILGQSFNDFELIISDNASTDRTQDICLDYANNDKRILYYRSEQNNGAAWNYNHVVRRASGEYFKWVAHDDLCAPELLDRCVTVLDDQSTVVLCYPRSVLINEKGEHIKNYRDAFCFTSPETHKRFRRFLRARGQCNAVFGLMRTDILKTTSLIGSYVASDRILLGQLALRGQIYEIPEYLFFRRIHPQSSLSANLDYKKRIAWFDPKKGKGIQLPRWRRFFESIRSIRDAHISPSVKTLCYIELAKWHLLHPKWAIADIAIIAQQILGGNPMKKRAMTSTRPTLDTDGKPPK